MTQGHWKTIIGYLQLIHSTSLHSSGIGFLVHLLVFVYIPYCRLIGYLRMALLQIVTPVLKVPCHMYVTSGVHLRITVGELPPFKFKGIYKQS